MTALLTVVGVLWPSSHQRMGRLRDWWRAWRAQDRMYPLWRALLRLRPALALDTPRSALRERLHVRDVRWRLYRRVIEIRDARLSLATRLTPARRHARARLAARGQPAEASRVEGHALAEVVAADQNPPTEPDGPGSHAYFAVGDRGGDLQSALPVEPVTSDLLEAADFLAEVSEHYVAALAEDHRAPASPAEHHPAPEHGEPS